MESLLEAPLPPRPLGEESLQMWDLNKRLEAYLARVKFLEEENEGLRSEVQRLRRGGPAEGSWRGRCEEEVAAWRARLDEAFREKSAAELARAALHEEAQQVQGRCQKERAAWQEAKELLALSRRALEEEKRGHIWLRERAAQLEKEAEALAEAHEEERARLEQEVAAFSWGLETFPAGPAAFRPAEVEDYSQRLSSIWRGAVETYKAEVSQLEASFGEAKESLWKATEGNRQSQLQLQHLQRELAGLKGRKEMLEERLAQQWHHQQGEAKKLQLAVQGLEEEKEALTVQIAQVLEDRRQLMHLKMSLSLEVATYRTLLEAESTRLQRPADHTLALSLPDGKLEVSTRKRQAVSLERGPRGSRAPKPSPTAFSKGGTAPQLPKSQSGPFAVHAVPALPKSRSPVVRECQKANTVLQSRSTKALEGPSAPAFLDSAAFQLGSSQQNEVMTASEARTVSLSFVPELPCFPALVPDALGESSSNAEQTHPPGEGREESSAPVKTRELGEGVELHEEVGEEEKPADEEPPWKTPLHGVPSPSPPQLVAGASGAAPQEVHMGEVRFEAGWLGAAETPNGIPSDDSSSTEEGNGAAAASPGTAAFEEATPELHKSPTEGLLEGLPGSEDSGAVNGGGPEVCSEQQEAEAGVWVSRDAEPSSLQETRLPEEGRSPSTQRNKEEVVFDIPVAGSIDGCNGVSASEQAEVAGSEQPPRLQGILQRGEPREGVQGTGSAGQLGMEAAATLRGDQDSPQPGTSGAEDHTGATGPDMEEPDGGPEDLDVVSTEALHLSEDEERRALSSPSRGSEEGDFQAEMLEREFLQAEEFAVETLSPPISHSFYSAESHQEHHFLGVEQEAPEEEASLSKTDSALPEEEGKEVDLEPETPRAEEEAARRDRHSTDSWTAEPRAAEGEEEEAGAQEPQQDVWGREDLLAEEDALGKEDTVQKEETATLQDWTWEQQTVLQQEDVESVPRQEASTGDQGEGTVEVCQGGDLPMAQQVEEGEEVITQGEQGEEIAEACPADLPVEEQLAEEEVTSKGEQGEETVDACQGGDLPMEQQTEEKEFTTQGEQGEETVEACPGDLPVEEQVAEEEVTTKGEQEEETVDSCPGDLPVEEQQMEEKKSTTQGEKGEETVDSCPGDLPVEEQVAEEEVTTKGEQEEETVDSCPGDLPVEEQQMEEKKSTTQGEKGEETVDSCPGDLPVEEQQMEEKKSTTQGEKGEETVDSCPGDLPVEEQVVEEEVTTKGEQEEETYPCQGGDLPMDQQVEEKEFTTQGEETVEACPGDLPVEEQVAEKEITTKGEQTVEVCQGDLPVEQQMEETSTQREETVAVCEGGDLPMEQQMEGKDITTQRDQTIEACQGDLPVDQLMEETIAQREQGEETGEACPGDLPGEEQAEEEGVAMAAPERDVLKGGDSITESEAMETEETESKTSLLEEAETMGYVTMRDVEETESLEAKLIPKADTQQAEEQHVTAEREETCPNQHSLHFDQSLPHDAGTGALETPSEARGPPASGFEAKPYRGPQEMDVSSGEGVEAELENKRHIELEETLPDSTPLHLYDEKMSIGTGKGQLLPEDEGTAEAPLLTKDRVTAAEATGQAAEEAMGPDRSQEGNGNAKVLESVDEEGGGYLESSPEQKPPSSEDLLASKDLEEVETETWELIRGDEEGLPPAREAEIPGAAERFPPLDAALEERPGGVGGHGSGARRELACGEVAREETSSPDFVWETERDGIFQPDPSFMQEGFQGGDDSPLGFSEPSDTAPEGSHKVSPLTSVADLGEIVLEEEEQSPDGQEDGAESEGFVYCVDERGPCVPDSQPNSGLENCVREEPTRQTDLPGLSSNGADFVDPSLEAEASLPTDSLRDSDILEIVEQALEFNQEVIWAAERTVEAENRAAQGGVLCSPVAERNGSSLAFSDVGGSQVPTEAPSAPSPDAKDPTGSRHLWAEDNGNGQQQDPRLADFTTEILNGLEGLHSGNREELIEEVAVRQHSHRQGPADPSPPEPIDQCPPQAPGDEEAPRTGEVSPETRENDSPEHRGQEGLNTDKSRFANRMQAAHLKGMDAEVEAVSVPPHFGEEILHLESSQHLKFRPEEEDELWSPEDN
ncbi:UNVERIFIED_CONTAM: hypothetical protein K2H54_032111 [Gekko kuhli]